MTSKLFLSIGHNPQKPGASHTHKDGTTIIEHFACSIIAAYLFQYLHQHNIKPILVPTGSLRQKANFVNTQASDDDILIEIHLNAFNTKVQGTECLSGQATAKLASNICHNISTLLNIKNRGVKPPVYHTDKPLYLAKHCKANLIIIEPFFLDREGAQFFDLQKTAEAIGKAILHYYAS